MADCKICSPKAIEVGYRANSHLVAGKLAESPTFHGNAGGSSQRQRWTCWASVELRHGIMGGPLQPTGVPWSHLGLTSHIWWWLGDVGFWLSSPHTWTPHTRSLTIVGFITGIVKLFFSLLGDGILAEPLCFDVFFWRIIFREIHISWESANSHRNFRCL